LPAEWLAVFARQPRFSNLSPSPDEAVVASTIRNSFAQPAGYAVIRYSRQREHEAMRAFTSRLAFTCAGVFAAFTLLLYAMLTWRWRRADRELSRAASALLGVAPSAGETLHSHALAADVAAINAQLNTAGRELAAVTRSRAMKAPSYLQRQLWLAIAAILLVVMAAICATVGLMYRTSTTASRRRCWKKPAPPGARSADSSAAASHDIALEKLVGVDALFADTAGSTRRLPTSPCCARANPSPARAAAARCPPR
jgi:hypothetical protein